MKKYLYILLFMLLFFTNAEAADHWVYYGHTENYQYYLNMDQIENRNNNTYIIHVMGINKNNAHDLYDDIISCDSGTSAMLRDQEFDKDGNLISDKKILESELFFVRIGVDSVMDSVKHIICK